MRKESEIKLRIYELEHELKEFPKIGSHITRGDMTSKVEIFKIKRDILLLEWVLNL